MHGVAPPSALLAAGRAHDVKHSQTALFLVATPRGQRIQVDGRDRRRIRSQSIHPALCTICWTTDLCCHGRDARIVRSDRVRSTSICERRHRQTACLPKVGETVTTRFISVVTWPPRVAETHAVRRIRGHLRPGGRRPPHLQTN